MTGIYSGDSFNGFRVFTCDMLTDTEFQLNPDEKHRFVEYEASDEWWLCKYGYGRYVQVPSLRCYQIGGNCLYLHPETWRRVKEQLDQEAAKRNKLSTAPIPQYMKFSI